MAELSVGQALGWLLSLSMESKRRLKLVGLRIAQVEMVGGVEVMSAFRQAHGLWWVERSLNLSKCCLERVVALVYFVAFAQFVLEPKAYSKPDCTNRTFSTRQSPNADVCCW